jgi:FixJ family two-component response regulator
MPVVHVVDDDPSFRRAISRRLRAAGFRVMAFGSAGEFLESRRPGSGGCALLDLRMPGPDGLELQEALLRQEDPLPVIFLTGQGDIPSSVEAMKKGAVDFLTKPVAGDALLEAVSRALALDATAREARRSAGDWRARFDSLTPREREVFALVVRGLLNKQIAAELGTTERTIKAHRQKVMQKMRADSLAELARAAERLGDGFPPHRGRRPSRATPASAVSPDTLRGSDRR